MDLHVEIKWVYLLFLFIENMLKWAKALICKCFDACCSIQLQIIMFYAFVVLCVCAREPYLTLICGAS